MAMTFGTSFEDKYCAIRSQGYNADGSEWTHDALSAWLRATLEPYFNMPPGQPTSFTLPPVPPAVLPARVVLTEGTTLHDFSARIAGGLVVSERFKNTVESIEPGVHQFVPVPLFHKDGTPYAAPHYYFYVRSLIDAINPEYGGVRLQKNSGYKENPDAYHWNVRGGSGRLAVYKNLTEGHAAWLDRRFQTSTTRFFSDALMRRMDAENMEGYTTHNEWRETGRYGLVGVFQDKSKAFQWYKTAAGHGDRDAQYCLGSMYAYSQGVHEDTAEALKWYRAAAEQGHAKAQFALSTMYLFGQGVPEDKTEALKWHKTAAEQGDAVVQFLLACLYDEGKDAPGDKAEAAKWYRRAAEQGLAGAQYRLGTLYLDGQGVPADPAEAARWFRKAAEQGHANAQFSLGMACDMGLGVPRDKAEATKWCGRAAAKGESFAQYYLAAGRGDVEAQIFLGERFSAGETGFFKYRSEAVKWFRMAADQGNAGAQFSLGELYFKGEGIPGDQAEAIKWYRLAAEHGHDLAGVALGNAYAEGQGVPEDKAEAVKWYRLAAEQGNARAKFCLGAAYYYGRGVRKDKTEGLKWIDDSARHGYPGASMFLFQLRNFDKHGVPLHEVAARRAARGWRTFRFYLFISLYGPVAGLIVVWLYADHSPEAAAFAFMILGLLIPYKILR
ncbi:MAG: sel1 repeat family protein [Methylobacteriaceae bacterium]|jgi:TPR repeat protein|nr:sel1 repeat family protein [Methylobacteriaceae bacterium]